MAKATRTVNWTTKDGRDIEVTIERIKEVNDNIVDADGDKVNLGKKTLDLLCIEVKADGNHVTRANRNPLVLSERDYRTLKTKGVYARLGDTFISKVQYDMVIAALAEIDAELNDTQEYKEVKAAEDAKVAAQEAADEATEAEYKRLVERGLCLKCGTWCYGDCEAN